MNLKGKKIILTGAGRGIGKVVAQKLAVEGANIALIARSANELNETLDSIITLSPESFIVPANLASESSIIKAFNQISSRFDSIDVLINNAGVQGPIGLFHENNFTEWENNIRINLLGPALLTQLVLPFMIKQTKGKIINLSGGGATSTRSNFSAYAVAKTAIVRLTENLAEEYKANCIDVNAVSPGAVNTKMLEEVIGAQNLAGKEYKDALSRKLAGGTDPSIAASLISFLASDLSDGITGKLISAPWDPWQEETFCHKLRSEKDIATLRRIDNKFFIKKT